MEFSALQVIIGLDSPAIIDFNQFKTIDTFEDAHGHTYQIETELIDNKFFWISADFGKEFPRSTNVYDKEKQKAYPNPRKSYQVELNHQLFALYDFSRKILYVSNIKKKLFLEEYIKAKLEKDTIIKNYLLNADEFIEKITTINSIYLRSKKHLFSENNDIFADAENLFGLGKPADFTVEIKYNKAGKTTAFVNKFKTLKEKYDNREIDSLICIGRDDEDLEAIFNISSFTQKMSLNIKKDEQGMYNAKEVKALLFEKLR